MILRPIMVYNRFRRYLADKFGIDIEYPNDGQTNPAVLSSLDVDGVVEYIKDGRAKNIIVMAGAGISTSAGIPDFRTPGSGLYDNLKKYNLPNPTAIFDIRYFAKNPKPFFTLAKELYPGSFNPTPSHYFVKLLEEADKLKEVSNGTRSSNGHVATWIKHASNVPITYILIIDAKSFLSIQNLNSLV